MKIGFVSTWFERGATQVTLAFMKALEHKHELVVYARGGDEFPIEDPRWNKPFVHWGEFVPGARNTYIDKRDFLAWLKRESPDVLLFNEQQSWDVILWLTDPHLESNYGCKRPVIGAYIDYYTDETVPFFELYDFLICNTLRHFSVFDQHRGAFYVPWAVDLERFPASSEVHNPVTFFHSFGYNPQRKGTDLVVKAFKKMRTEARLVLHAQRPPSDFPELKALIDGHPRIAYIHREVPPPGLYHMGDIYLYPSRLDGIGLSLPEALASGLPALTTDEAPMNEFVSDHINGYLIEVEAHHKRADGYYWKQAECSIDALTGRMEELASNPTRVRELKAATRRDAEQRFDPTRFAKKLQEAFDQAALSKSLPTTYTPELIDQCRSYETSRSPQLTVAQRIHRLLIGAGVRKLKRKLFGRG